MKDIITPTEEQILAVLPQHNTTLLLSNYLAKQGINSRVEKVNTGFAIICSLHHITSGKVLLEQFVQNPHHARYQEAAWQQSKTETVDYHGHSLLTIFKEKFLAHAGITTLVVFIIVWLIYIASQLGLANELFTDLQFNQKYGASLFAEPYRLITPIFLHFSLLHIVFNSFWWWQLAGDIEKKLGKWPLISLLLISALLSNIGQFYASGPNFGGLSGVVYGLFGYVWWLGWLVPSKGISINNSLVALLLVWLMLGFADVLPVNMANIAHLLGLISGCALALFSSQTIYKKSE